MSLFHKASHNTSYRQQTQGIYKSATELDIIY